MRNGYDRGSNLSGDAGAEGEEHGGLVQKILETKKTDEQASSAAAAKTTVTIVSVFEAVFLQHKY